MHIEKKLSSELLYQGKIVTLRRDLVELEDGSTAFREVIGHHGGVAILAIDDDNHVFLVRQFRYPYGKELLELPAGKLEAGEDPLTCGKRELEEETGFRAESFESLGEVYPTPGYTDEVLHLYLATQLYPTRQKLDEDEFLTVLRMPFSQVLTLCLNGEIQDAKTLIAVLKYQQILQR